jgi:hypothetical protein
MPPVSFSRRWGAAVTLAVGAAVWLASGCERQAGAPPPTSRPSEAAVKPPDPSAVPVLSATAPAEPRAAVRRVIAYYFHRTLRCDTCLTIERYAREAVEVGYTDDLRAGGLEWHAVNIEEPENRHFEKDFALETQSLVLVEMGGDQVTRWKNLKNVWQLVENQMAFENYVWTELDAFRDGREAGSERSLRQ